MNYDQIDEIKEKYPLSWELFLLYSGLKTAWHPFDDPMWYRRLYDFFDLQEIAVEIGVDLTLEAKYCYRVFYLKDGEWINSGIGVWSDLFYTRQEAEKEAFVSAFKIFERMLNLGEIKVGDEVTPKDHPRLKGEVETIEPFMGEITYVLTDGRRYTRNELN